MRNRPGRQITSARATAFPPVHSKNIPFPPEYVCLVPGGSPSTLTRGGRPLPRRILAMDSLPPLAREPLALPSPACGRAACPSLSRLRERVAGGRERVSFHTERIDAVFFAVGRGQAFPSFIPFLISGATRRMVRSPLPPFGHPLARQAVEGSVHRKNSLPSSLRKPPPPRHCEGRRPVAIQFVPSGARAPLIQSRRRQSNLIAARATRGEKG
jgi:hypothetical protein